MYMYAYGNVGIDHTLVLLCMGIVLFQDLRCRKMNQRTTMIHLVVHNETTPQVP